MAELWSHFNIAGTRTIVIILLATLKISLLVAICQCGPALKKTFTYAIHKFICLEKVCMYYNLLQADTPVAISYRKSGNFNS